MSFDDFDDGTVGTDTYITSDGVILKPGIAEEFTNLPVSGWQSFTWNGDNPPVAGTGTVSDGSLIADGSRFNTESVNATYSPGSSIEFMATFTAVANQHIGFGAGDDVEMFNTKAYWILFSTGIDGNNLKARIIGDGNEVNYPIPGDFLGSKHRYKINWNVDGIQFFIDDALIPTPLVTLTTTPMRVGFSDLNAGAPTLNVDWIRISPYPSAGTFTSRVYDGGSSKTWQHINWLENKPSGTSLQLSYRLGNTPDPEDNSWTNFVSVSNSGDMINEVSRYIQYRAVLSTSDPTVTPVLKSVSINCESYCPPVTFMPSSGTALSDANANSDYHSEAITINQSDYTLTADGLPAGLEFNNGVISGTPTSPDNYEITITAAKNGDCIQKAYYPIKVNDPYNLPPVVKTIGNKTATVGNELTFQVDAYDPELTSLFYSLINDADNPSNNADIDFETGIFRWTPTAPGTYNFTVRVTDDGFSPKYTDQDFTVTVSNLSTSTIRINSGGGTYSASDNREFIADKYYYGTSRPSTSISGVDIKNTNDDELYRNSRSDKSFNYKIPIKNGIMDVRLHFAEIWWGIPGRGEGSGSGKRKFNVAIEGNRKLTNYDIFAKTGGALRAVQETFQVTVTDGILNIDFTSGSADQPAISAIEVVPSSNVAPVLAKIGNKTVAVGKTLTFTASATDANTTQSKTYSLVNPPSGATINGPTGVFNWKPSTAGTYTFIVKVTDNGSPVKSDQEEITVAVTRSLTLLAAADAFVRNGSYTTTNYGNNTTVAIKGSSSSGYTRFALIKFPLGSVNQVSSARLRIYGRNDEDNAGINLLAYGVNDNWTETGITWNNSPSGVTSAIGSVVVNSQARYYEIDVTTYVKSQLSGNKIVSILLNNNSNQNKTLLFNSRENSSNRPQLVIETTTAATAVLDLIAEAEEKEEIEESEQPAPAARMISPEIVDNEISLEKSVLYPNPVRHRFTVELAKQHKEKVSMQVINLSGKTYPVTIPDQMKAGLKTEVDISGLSLKAGVYLLRIQSASKSEVIKMLVID